MKDGYGMKYGDLLMYLDHNTLSWKMCQDYLQRTKGKPLKELSKILPRAGAIDLNGKLYQQDQLVQHTLEKDSSELASWQTPNTMDHLPPRTGKALENALYRGDKEKKSKRKMSGNLRENPKITQYPTPLASQATKPINKEAPSVKAGKHGATLEMELGEKNPEMIGKRLNYGWVARLMGFPDGWLN